MYGLAPYTSSRSPGIARRDFDDLFEKFLGGAHLPVFKKGDGFVPSVDINETDQAVEITAEVPGLRPEEIEVTLTGDIISLKGEKKMEHEEEKDGYHYCERRFGSFQRSFRLPGGVDKNRLSAVHKDGVLTVTLPKIEEEVSTHIEIKSK